MGEERTIRNVENGWIIIQPQIGRRTGDEEGISFVFKYWDELIEHLQEDHIKGGI